MMGRDRTIGMATLGLSLLPWILLAPNLPPAGAAAVPAGIGIGLLVRRIGITLPRHLLTLISLAVTLFLLSRLTLADPITPLATLLQILLGVRLAGEESGRTTLQIVALSILSLAVASVWELGLRYLLVSLVSLVTAGGLLTLVTYADQCPDGVPIPAGVLRVALILPLTAIPLAVLLFPILPRTQHPLWNILPAAGGSRTGTPDRVHPGVSESVGDDPGVAFRVESDPIPPERLYWRVRVFNRLEGGVWVRDPSPPAERLGKTGGRQTRQRFLITGGGHSPLPALDPSLAISLPRVKRSDDGMFVPTGIRTPTLRYEAVSVDAVTSRPVDPGAFHRFYTRLGVVDPRFHAASQEIFRRGGSSRERLDLVVSLFREHPLRYGTSGLAGGKDPAAAFFFDGGTGNFEHFASAFAIIARGAGIPARVVGGYLGGDYNPLASYYLLRGSHAHVWVEVWLEGGWERVDPTLFADRFRSERQRRSLSLATRIAAVADTVEYWWSQSVVTYDVERQIATIASAGRLLSPGRLPLRQGVMGGVAIAVIAVALLVARRKGWGIRRGNRGLLRRLEQTLQRQGAPPRRDSEGVLEYGERIGDPLVIRFARLYGEGVYREGRIDGERYRELKRLLGEIRSVGLREGPSTVEGDDPDAGDGDRRNDHRE